MPLGMTLKLDARHVPRYSARLKEIVKQRDGTTGESNAFGQRGLQKERENGTLQIYNTNTTVLLSLFILFIMEMFLCNSFLFCSGPRHPPYTIPLVFF